FLQARAPGSGCGARCQAARQRLARHRSGRVDRQADRRLGRRSWRPAAAARAARTSLPPVSRGKGSGGAGSARAGLARLREGALLKDLHLLEAMALDDLGRPGDALAAASKAVELDGKDREARREKGVALFELCRFDEARAELEKLGSEEPDAWAEHYLGLIAERAQDEV